MEKEGEQVAEKVKRQMECMGYRVGILNGNDLINKALSIPKNIIEINKSIKEILLKYRIDYMVMEEHIYTFYLKALQLMV